MKQDQLLVTGLFDQLRECLEVINSESIHVKTIGPIDTMKGGVKFFIVFTWSRKQHRRPSLANSMIGFKKFQRGHAQIV